MVKDREILEEKSWMPVQVFFYIEKKYLNVWSGVGKKDVVERKWRKEVEFLLLSSVEIDASRDITLSYL